MKSILIIILFEIIKSIAPLFILSFYNFVSVIQVLQEIFQSKNYIEIIKIFLQILGGIGVFWGLSLTNRKIQVTEDGQITERFTRAIDQLGSDKMEIRLGAIYALERIARESKKDHWPIMEILSAYVRENSKLQFDEKWNQLPCENISIDIQAIMTVIGRRLVQNENENKLFIFTKINLQGVDLQNANLEKFQFMNSNLKAANFIGVNFKKATLTMSTLEGSCLADAKLQDAVLGFTKLMLTDLTSANLSGAKLVGANIEGSVFFDAILDGIQDWKLIKSFKQTDITGIKNAPVGFKKYALEHGAVEQNENQNNSVLLS